ncbi:GAF domain-containing protein [Actinoplanes sp. NPDC051513]|uniref:GAF domain-containing protein n=1 Tax=Actinoplanes sp. NPDC051513 TaxID=3363908 RepID=UPI0037AA06A9
MTPAHGALASAMIRLAATPERSSDLRDRLRTIAKLTAERVAAARYASITALQGDEYITVAVSDDQIQSVDDAQYADDAGPCLEALAQGTPVGVPDIDTTVQWPGFHQEAPRMGLQASVSVPLFSGRGQAVAVLNVYSHDQAAMAPLIAAISSVHGHPARETTDKDVSGLDDGGRELVAGYAEALSVRATIQLALDLIRAENRCSPDDAYLRLCIQAGEAGTDLAGTATTLISHGV